MKNLLLTGSVTKRQKKHKTKSFESSQRNSVTASGSLPKLEPLKGVTDTHIHSHTYLYTDAPILYADNLTVCLQVQVYSSYIIKSAYLCGHTSYVFLFILLKKEQCTLINIRTKSIM